MDRCQEVGACSLQKSIYISQRVLDAILRLGCHFLGRTESGALGKEVSGLLLGEDVGDRIVIFDFITGDQISEPHFTSLSDNFLARVAQGISDGSIKGRIFGWFHTHPGIGLFLSAIDVKTLRNMQRLSYDAIAIVIDPLSPRRFRFFRYDFETGRPYDIQVNVYE